MNALSRLKAMFTKPYPTISALKAAELLKLGAVLVDVREPHEWRAGHAANARHIPLGQLPARLTELPDRRPVLVVCRSGMRSARAAKLLAREGRLVHNIAGGMAAWVSAGLPIVAKGGGAGRVA